MKVLPGIDFLEDSLNHKNYPNNLTNIQILYNEENNICLTKKYIQHIENEISNKDAFQALLKELWDTNRLCIENTSEKNSLEDEFTEIALQSNHSVLIPIIIEDEKQLIKKIPSLLIVSNVIETNDHWIKYSLLSTKNCNVSFQNFKSDKEISSFFENVFSIAKFIGEIFVFDRETSDILLSKLKNSKIKYYTFLKGNRNKAYTLIPEKKILRKTLGGKLRLYYTCNPRNIHERKIIYENILITIDNSRSNITIKEPTWDIFITVNKKKATEWKLKCKGFSELTDN